MESEKVIKQQIKEAVEKSKTDLLSLSDFIYRHPETGFEEVQAVGALTDYLAKQGFSVETGYGSLPTAFRAVWQNGQGGPCIGLLCEYDALPGLGHACAHHLQGPSMIGAALAIKTLVKDVAYTLAIIGTPGEECSNGGKNIMLENGAFQELDVALMMHGSDTTTTDIKSMAASQFLVTYKGKSAHAAIAPEQGRSPLEAVMLAFNGLAFLRGHVKDDVRIHGIVVDGGQAVNVIPDTASAKIEVRSYERSCLDQVIERIGRILDGAALMTDTSYTLEKIAAFHNKIPVLSLNELLMKNAIATEAKRIAPPREKTGSTDFASVMHFIPGSCIRVCFIGQGIAAHSREWLEQGLSGEAHEALLTAAQIVAMTVWDLICKPECLAEIKNEFQAAKNQAGS